MQDAFITDLVRFLNKNAATFSDGTLVFILQVLNSYYLRSLACSWLKSLCQRCKLSQVDLKHRAWSANAQEGPTGTAVQH